MKKKLLLFLMLISFLFFTDAKKSFSAEEPSRPSAKELMEAAIGDAFQDWLVYMNEKEVLTESSWLPNLSEEHIEELAHKLSNNRNKNPESYNSQKRAELIFEFLREEGYLPSSSNNSESSNPQGSASPDNTGGTLPIDSVDGQSTIDFETWLNEYYQQSSDPDLYVDQNISIDQLDEQSRMDFENWLNEYYQQSSDPDLYANENLPVESSGSNSSGSGENLSAESGGSSLNGSGSSNGNLDCSLGVCLPKNTQLPDPAGDDPVTVIIKNVMMWLLGVVGFIAIIAFVISGMQYLLSAGDQNMMETAKRNMKWSIVGVIVALMGLIILNFIISMMGGISEPTSFNNKSEKNILAYKD